MSDVPVESRLFGVNSSLQPRFPRFPGSGQRIEPSLTGTCPVCRGAAMRNVAGPHRWTGNRGDKHLRRCTAGACHAACIGFELIERLRRAHGLATTMPIPLPLEMRRRLGHRSSRADSLTRHRHRDNIRRPATLAPCINTCNLPSTSKPTGCVSSTS